MQKFIVRREFGVTKILVEVPGQKYPTVVADFCASPEGAFAFSCWLCGMAAKQAASPAVVIREATGDYLVGSVDLLDGAQ
jgi:hypothetical protein